MDANRAAYWRRRLRPLRLDAEPIDRQLARRSGALAMLSGISAIIGLMFLAIFASFGRPDVGAGVVGVLLVPVVAWSWLDFVVLQARAFSYLEERAAHESGDDPPG